MSVRYAAEWHRPGEPSAELTLHDTPRQAWDHLIDLLVMVSPEIMWDEAEPDEPTVFHTEMMWFSDNNQPDWVLHEDGFIYMVETRDPRYKTTAEYMVGDDDNLPYPRPGRKCRSTSYYDRTSWWQCGREQDHGGNHAAGDGTTIQKVWQ